MNIDGHTLTTAEQVDGTVTVWEVDSDGIEDIVCICKGGFNEDQVRKMLKVDPMLRHQEQDYIK